MKNPVRHGVVGVLLTGMSVAGVVLPAWGQGGWLDKVPFLKSDSVSASKPAEANPTGGLRGGQEGKTALVRVLDKQTNRLQTVAGQVNGQVPGVPMKLAIGRCVKSIEGVPGQDAAWLVVGPLEGDEAWFEGWMFNTYPDVATLDHARYDVQLVACDKSRDDDIAPVLPVIKVDEMLGRDDEAPKREAQTPAEGVADDGTDPYYVPGVGAGTVVTAPDAEAAVPVPPEPAAPEEAVVVDNNGYVEARPVGEAEELHELMDGQ